MDSFSVNYGKDEKWVKQAWMMNSEMKFRDYLFDLG